MSFCIKLIPGETCKCKACLPRANVLAGLDVDNPALHARITTIKAELGGVVKEVANKTQGQKPMLRNYPFKPKENDNAKA